MKTVSQTVMLVDDSSDNLTVLNEILKPYYTILVANDGISALKLLRSFQKPDLILLDIVMPGLDGFEVCRRIKTNPSTAGIPIIFITGLTERKQIVRGFQAGAQDYVTKPFYPQELLARIKTHIDLKHRNEELKVLNATLEHRIDFKTRQIRKSNKKLKELNKALDEANKRLLALDGAKSRFIQIISHEIRTPLTGIIGFTELLQNSLQDSQYTEYLNALKESVFRLDQFSQKALFISNLMAGLVKPLLINLSLKDLIDRILQHFHKTITKKRLKIINSLSPGFNVVGDIDLTQIALRNVLENAIKFSEPDHTIIVRPLNRQSIEIINTGSHFSAEALRNIFELFSCGHEPIDRNFGLGLSVTKMIVEIQKGRVEALNLPGNHACLRLHFQITDKKNSSTGIPYLASVKN